MSHHHALPFPGLFLCPCEAQGISQQGGLPQDSWGFGGQCSQNPQASGRQHQHLQSSSPRRKQRGRELGPEPSPADPQRRSFLQSSPFWAAKRQS